MPRKNSSHLRMLFNIENCINICNCMIGLSTNLRQKTCLCQWAVSYRFDYSENCPFSFSKTSIIISLSLFNHCKMSRTFINFILFALTGIDGKHLTLCTYRQPPSGHCQTSMYRFLLTEFKSIFFHDIASYPFTTVENCYGLCVNETRCYGVDMGRGSCSLNDVPGPYSTDSVNTSLLDCCTKPGRYDRYNYLCFHLYKDFKSNFNEDFS
jgi:hypothetical protein